MIGTLVSDFLSQPLQEDDLFVFVACDDHQRVVGSILFSKLSFPNEENVFLLAPVAVATKWHGQGIGQALIRFGLEALKQRCQYCYDLRRYSLLLQSRIYCD